MKINICNLGIIKNAQIDLAPLTVFVGENGTGKTWTAYALAGIFGPHGYHYHKEAYIGKRNEQNYKPIDDAILAIIEKGNATINLESFVNEYAEIYFNQIAKSVPKWFNTFMATTKAQFDNTSFQIELSEKTKKKILDILKASHIETTRSIGLKQDASGIILNSLKEEGADELYYYITSETQTQEEIPQAIINKEVREFIVTETFRGIHRALFKDTQIFPTERTTFIAFRFPSPESHEGDALKEYKETKKGTKSKRVDSSPIVSKPVQHFLTMLGYSVRMFTERMTQGIKEPDISKFMELANLLENNILLGDIKFEERGNQVELIYTPTSEDSLELNISSSMVKELAPLAVYLRYLAEPGDLLVIDEPEMNLHPAAQVEIIEFLSMLINAGLNVLITTHSPYILDHLVNLIHAKESKKDENELKELFYLEETSSFLSKDDVAVYLFENGTAKNILMENGDIDWGTFSDVSHDVSQIYSHLI
ncbi:MAG: AAA family ATPase [Tissierellales bacterium]|nr:AAA family ATPase [Tissierellales bacterium]